MRRPEEFNTHVPHVKEKWGKKYPKQQQQKNNIFNNFILSSRMFFPYTNWWKIIFFRFVFFGCISSVKWKIFYLHQFFFCSFWKCYKVDKRFISLLAQKERESEPAQNNGKVFFLSGDGLLFIVLWVLGKTGNWVKHYYILRNEWSMMGKLQNWYLSLFFWEYWQIIPLKYSLILFGKYWVKMMNLNVGF